jgi:DNA-binding response OmpR family regulator
MLNGYTVFVVDDEAVIGETVAAVLNQAGYEATAFDDARLAVEAAAKSSPICL